MNDCTLLKKSVIKPIYKISAFTLLDYPGEVACILWFAGCNMRCAYCYNVDIVKGKGKLSYADALDFVRYRRNLLDAVVLSGGECTIHTGLEQFIRQLKSLDYLVKLDTNGTNPLLIKKLMVNKLVDFVALDFKGLKDRFHYITGSDHFTKFETSLDLLLQSDIPWEIRTTVHSALMDEKYLRLMASYLRDKGYKGKYFLQSFYNNTATLGNMENDYARFSDDIFKEFDLDLCRR